MASELVDLFVGIGLTEQKAKETIKNEQVSKNLKGAIDTASSVSNGKDLKEVGKLLYHIATKLKAQIKNRQPLLVEYVVKKKISSENQLNAAMEYLLSNPVDKIDIKEFEKASGVGVVISPEEIETAVEEVIGKYKNDLIESRYKFNTGKLLGEAKGKLKWADGKAVKNEVDMQILDLLGPKTDADLEKAPKQKAPKPAKTAQDSKTDVPASTEDFMGADGHVKSFMDLMGDAVKFHKTGENYKTDGYVITPNTMDILKEHLKKTGGKVYTRFPPEPNGILHIGHAKAINFNFGYAKWTGGNCYIICLVDGW
ncbi:glutamine--tRNA ligase [Patella vulgata]|uniref:glutamine--tRNA ligase n=1 Tax=Patella vulgata TaxID=6465 RepID=UPI0024A875E3|nr:glutamine--tRNA ligase [Patella vulgata]